MGPITPDPDKSLKEITPLIAHHVMPVLPEHAQAHAPPNTRTHHIAGMNDPDPRPVARQAKHVDRIGPMKAHDVTA